MHRPNLMVCATDSGGAAVTAPVAALARNRGWRVTVFAGPASKGGFSRWGFEPLQADRDLASQVGGGLAPDAILLGTTRYMSLERSITELARHLRIPTIAVVDDWSNYHLRFQDEHSRLRLPDLICCPDQLAYREMVAEGIDEKHLIITGHPALAAVVDRLPHFLSTTPPRPAFFPSDGRQIVLFLSETHSIDFGSTLSERGQLGPFLGYCELSVRAELARITSKFYVIEKMHPADRRSLPSPKDATLGRWLMAPSHPLWETLWHADAVVGMKSVALIESALLGRPTVSYQPGLIGPDPCTASRIGLVAKIDSIGELSVWLRRTLGQAQRFELPTPDFASPSASANVLAAITGLLGTE